MHALLELVREAPPEDLKEIADIFKHHLGTDKPVSPKLLSVDEFQSALQTRLGITKRKDWIRNDLFAQCPALKDFAYGLNAGRGHRLKIDERAIDWIDKHRQLIDWRG